MKIQQAKGTRDVQAADKLLKNKIVNTFQEIFERYGFMPLETPILERMDTLSAKFAAGENSDALKEIFRLKDQGKRDLGLRFDLTVPLARYVAMNPTLKMPFKRYAVGRVFRDGPIKLGRYREFWQMDIDTVGTSSMLADAEIVAMTAAAFKALDLKVKIKINNRKVLNGILEQAGIKDKESAIIAIDKLDKIGKSGVSEELKERGYTIKQIEAVFSLISPKMTLAQLRKKLTTDIGKEGLQELTDVFSYLKSMDVSQVVFDVSLARGLAYYTGTVFEAYLENGPVLSSLAGGGRYDNMIGNYLGGGRVVPAMGISFGIEPTIDTLKALGKIDGTIKTKAFVIPINTVDESLKVVQDLRNEGIAADISLGKKGVSKNLQYANALSIPYSIIIGENELKKKKVLLRDMSSGTETLLSVKDVVKKLKSLKKTDG
jgi:histidyl-tRNA synthetase